MTDFYAVLGVPREVDEEGLKKAYRRLAMECHPDRNNGDRASEERFKEITQAYDVLRDPEKRRAYDRYGEAGLRPGVGGAGGFGGFHPFDLAEALNVFMRDFGAFGGFEELFGGRSARGVRRGDDVKVAVSLTLQDVALGVKEKLTYRVLERCGRCGGSGAEPGSRPERCAACGGSGEVRRAQRSIFGQFVSVSPCPACGGEGQVIAQPCSSCRGDGRTRVQRTVSVDVPPGVSSSNYLTLRHQGHAAPRGGPAGDLIVALDVEEDPRFERHGDDLLYDLPVSFTQAALGAEFEVPTPYGEERVRVAPGTQTGTLLTLRGRGLPHLGSGGGGGGGGRGGRGDLHVRVQVWTPQRLTPEQERLMRELAEHEGEPPSAEHLGRSFWSRMKAALGA